MYYLIKKYQKKLLAVFAVLLMVAFVATLGVRGPSTSRYDPVVAKAGDASIKDSDMRRARDDWEMANRLTVPMGQGFGQQRVPLPYRMLPFTLVQDIQQHPELFLLLQLEAKRDGLSVDLDDARSLVANIIPEANLTDPRMQGAVNAAQALLLVGAEVNRLGTAIKVSAPEWQHAAAQEYSTVRLNLIDFKTDEFERSVPVPTPDQLRQQFEKYKDTPPLSAGSEPPKDNPLGFGYQIPARVKLQYLTIPHAQMVQAVKGDANHQYDLQVQAADYYQSHQEEFRNTPPATQPTTGPATTQTTDATTQPASTQTASSQPVIKPFAEVKDQIIDQLIATDVQRRTAQIEKEIISRLATDWINIRKADPSATQPASTQPATSQPADVASAAPALQPAAGDPRSLAHLEQVRDDIQKQFGVQLELHDIAGTWQSTAELGKLPGIGSASTAPPSPETFAPGESFPQYALSFTQKPGSLAVVPLQVWEPSQPLSDTQQNAYVFRLTAAEAPHAPPDMSVVADRIAADWRTAQAYDQAKQAAQKLLDAAKTIGLSQAARNGSLNILTVGPFLPRGSEPIPNYPLDPAAREQLGKSADDLIKAQTQQDRHPAALAELPTARRVAVAELAGTALRTFEWYAQMQATNFQQSERFRKLAQQYFTYDQVVSRLGYKPEESAKRT